MPNEKPKLTSSEGLTIVTAAVRGTVSGVVRAVVGWLLERFLDA